MALALIAGACSNGSDSSDGGDTAGSTGPGETTAPRRGRRDPDRNRLQRGPVRGRAAEVGGSITFGVESTIATLDPAGNLAQPADIVTALAVFHQLVTTTTRASPPPTSPPSGRTPTTSRRTRSAPRRREILRRHAVRHRRRHRPLHPPQGPGHQLHVRAQRRARQHGEGGLDPNTVVFPLTEANAFFPTVLTGAMGIVASPTATRNGAPTTPATRWAPARSSSSLRHACVLKKNPDYWKKDGEGRQLPYLDEIHRRAHHRLPRPPPDAQGRGHRPLPDRRHRHHGRRGEGGNFELQKVTGSSSTITIFNLRKPPLRATSACGGPSPTGSTASELNNVL